VEELASKDHYVVGIGASAGGLEAIHEFFDNLTIPVESDIQISFIIVQHLSPDYKTMMPELLSKHTNMNVFEAEDGMDLQSNTIYVIPSKMLMTVKNGKLRLREKSTFHVPNISIDTFLESLAHDFGNKSIGVILSGTGTDGSRGVEHIKKAGGIVLVQNPENAKFDGMPNSAIASGYSDFILPVKDIPNEILNYLRQKPLESYISSVTEKDEVILNEIFNLIKIRTAYDFTYYKRPTILRRLLRRMSLNKIQTLLEYRNYLIDYPEEVSNLSKEFLIGVTHFFRDTEAFDFLKKVIIPEIILEKSSDEPLKIWSAGCSTGEEAYSLAILVKEYLQKVGREMEVKIFATDIDKEAIEYASKGIYPASIEKDVTEERLEQFFSREGSKYLVSPHIRKMVIFAHHNVIKDPPFGRTDLVVCRNMLIYLNPVLQKKVLSLFHFSLNLGGYLFLGPSENPGDLRDSFEEVNKKWKIFKNIQASKSVRTEPIARLTKSTVVPVEYNVGSSNRNFIDTFNEMLVEEYDCAGIFVNENFELVHAIGNYKKFLYLPDKNFNLNLLKMAPEDLSIPLSSCLRKASKENHRVEMKSVRVKSGDISRTVNISVKPYTGDKKFFHNLYLVLLTELKEEKQMTSSVFEKDEDVRSQFFNLQEELRETKENLQSAVEELEAANEELQSSNEELISANEELQSTNEELQSLNEELHTVNTEHQLKIKQLIQLNDDFNNYFRSNDIGQIFLDMNMIIRKFTPAAVKHINLIENDIGRPITHISNNIKYNHLPEDIKEVLSTHSAVEKEVEVMDGRFYQMKILPYIRQDRNIDGVVITFVDVTVLKTLNNKLSSVLNNSLDAVMAFKSVRNEDGRIKDFQCIMANSMAEKMFSRKEDVLMHETVLSLNPPNKEFIFGKFLAVVQHLAPEYFQFELISDNDQKQWYEVAAAPMEDGLVVSFSDITDKKLTEEKIELAYEELKKAEGHLRKLNNELEKRVEDRTKELAVSEERFRLLSKATSDVVWDWNMVKNELWWNDNIEKLFGYGRQSLDGGIEFWYKLIHEEDRGNVIKSINDVINKGKEQWVMEYRLKKANNEYAFVLDRAHVIHDDNGMPYRIIGSKVDITNLKSIQEELRNTNENLRKINEDLDNFIYTASHDLKAPVSNIEGLVSTLSEELGNQTEEVQYILSLIKHSVDQFKLTIQELTEITKVQKGVYGEEEEVDVKEITEEVLINIREMIHKNHAQVNIDCGHCPKIKFSKKNLKSIIYNLISNGIKYHHPGRDPLVELKTEELENEILMSVTDNGLGIPKSKQGKIFSMFKRLHDHVEGTGIGLYIVKRIVENNGGRIEMVSEENVGTTFNIYFKKK